MIDIRNFHSNVLKLDKKSHDDIDIYYIGYITTKNFSDHDNIHSVNPLYLINHSATEYFKEKNGEKYAIIDSTEKYEEFFSGIISEIKTLNSGKELFYKKIIKELELMQTKPLKFPTLTIIIICVLQKDEKFCLQIYLDEYLYEFI